MTLLLNSFDVVVHRDLSKFVMACWYGEAVIRLARPDQYRERCTTLAVYYLVSGPSGIVPERALFVHENIRFAQNGS